MAKAPEKIKTDKLCSYGCGKVAQYKYKNGKLCCSISKNKCSSMRRKNSDGINKNGIWNKGLTKETDKSVLKYSISGKNTRRSQVENGEYVVWNKGLTIKDERVWNNVKDLSKNRKGYYHTLKYFVDKFGTKEGEEKYLELNKLKALTLENFIDKYGDDDGIKRYLDLFNKKNKIKFYSKVSQELFDSLLKNINFDKIYYAEYNKEYGIKSKKRYYFYDFVVLDNKKIIEFNGDIWHANPNLYDNNNKPFCYENIDLNEIWDFEKKKLRIAKNRGFEILVIWENEYRDSKDEVINKCLKFLNNE